MQYTFCSKCGKKIETTSAVLIPVITKRHISGGSCTLMDYKAEMLLCTNCEDNLVKLLRDTILEFVNN